MISRKILYTCIGGMLVHLFSACLSHKKHQEPPLTDMERLLALKSGFRYHNMHVFEKTDSLSWEERTNCYKTPDSITSGIIWKDNQRIYMADGYEQDYLYSWQERDTNFIEFVILSQDEDNYCDHLLYCIFGRDGQLRSRFTLSSFCGDAEWSFIRRGRFVSRDIYEGYWIEAISSDEDEVYKEEGDSVRVRLRILKDGTIREDTLGRYRYYREQPADIYSAGKSR